MEDSTGSNSGSSSGYGTESKSKVEQIVRELLAKCSQIILQARIPLSSGKSKVNKWFNLEMEEFDLFNEDLQNWRMNLHTPLFINIFFCTQRKDKMENIALERWKLYYEPLNSLNETIEIPTLYKKLILLIRTLYIFVRSTVIYKIFRECKKNKLSSSKIVYQFTKTEPVHNNELLSEFRFEPVYSPYGKFSLSVLMNDQCSFKQLSAYDEALLSSRFIIQDYDPVEKIKETDPVDIKTKPIGIPIKSSYQASSHSRSIPDTPPFTSEAFSPPFSSKPVMVPGSSTHKAFSSTPPFSQGNSSTEPPLTSPSSSFSSKSPINNRPPSLKLNISPFKDPSSNVVEQQMPNKTKMNPPLSTPLYTSLSSENSISKLSSIITGEEPAFVSSDSFRDQDSEVGSFVAQCQAAPPLIMFENSLQMSSNFGDVLQELHNFESGLET